LVAASMTAAQLVGLRSLRELVPPYKTLEVQAAGGEAAPIPR
jgi:hypothetical protein